MPYYTGRKKDALKLKPFFDDEGIVTSHIEGKGKQQGKLGAIKCNYKGKQIKIGSGFNNLERENPPIIGSTISFKYYGLTSLGNPKYPIYLRIRPQ